MGSAVLVTRLFPTPTLSATVHSVTDTLTDRRQYDADANSRTYCVTVRSAKVYHVRRLSASSPDTCDVIGSLYALR